MAAAPAAHTAADGEPEATAAATIASTPSRLRATAPISGVVARSTPMPVVIRLFSLHRGGAMVQHTQSNRTRLYKQQTQSGTSRRRKWRTNLLDRVECLGLKFRARQKHCGIADVRRPPLHISRRKFGDRFCYIKRTVRGTVS